jgi:hypothetical protein
MIATYCKNPEHVETGDAQQTAHGCALGAARARSGRRPLAALACGLAAAVRRSVHCAKPSQRLSSQTVLTGPVSFERSTPP